MEPETRDSKILKSVLPSHMGGGPLGLGDPDSKELRHVESDILIPELMREKAKLLCDNYGEAYANCCKGRTVTMATACRKEAHVFGACLKKWMDNEAFKAMCKTEYLETRSTYRRTGVKQETKRIQGMHSQSA